MGKTTAHGLLIAKASTEDIEAAMDLVAVVDSIGRGYYPTINSEETETTPTYFSVQTRSHLMHLYELIKGIADRGGLFRVVLGMHAILRNDILDPDVDHLAIHPKFAAESKRLRDALAALVGSGDVAELRGMEAAIRELPAPDEDKAVTINAIHVLIATAQEAEVAHD